MVETRRDMIKSQIMSHIKSFNLPISIEISLIPRRWKRTTARVIATSDMYLRHRSLEIKEIGRVPYTGNSDLGSAVSVFMQKPSRRVETSPDAHRLRDEFLSMMTDSPAADEELLAFLNRYGALSKHQQDVPFFEPADLWAEQSRLRNAMVQKATLEDFILGRYPELLRQLELIPEWPYTKLNAAGWNTASNTATMLDLLNGAKFGICARKDCSGVYEFSSDHKRSYCSPECAHVVAVRNSRERAAKKSSKRKR